MAEDIVSLGFAFTADTAESEIQKLINKFGELVSAEQSASTAASTLFGSSFSGMVESVKTSVENFNSALADTADAAKRISQDFFSSTLSGNVETVKAALSGFNAELERTNAINQTTKTGLFDSRIASRVDSVAASVGKMNADLSSAGAKAGSPLRDIFSTEFFGRLRGAKADIDTFNNSLRNTAVSARDAARALNLIPKRLEKLSTAKMNFIPPETIEDLKKFAANAEKAASSVQTLSSSSKTVKLGNVNSFNESLKETKDSASDLNDILKKIFTSVSVGAFFKKSTEAAIAFGEELAHINSLTLDFDMGAIRSGLLNISSEFGSAVQNANAMYYAYSSGVRGTEADLALFTEKMAQTATLIRASVTPTVDAVTTAMNAYGKSARDANEMTDLFYMIVKNGKANGQQLASSFGQVVSTAKAAGLTLNELGASVASLTKVNQTRNAITFLNNMISKLIKPTKETALAANKLGIELGLNALQAKGFAGMMQEIHDKTKGSQQAILSLFPDLRGQRAALQLLGQGWNDFQYQLSAFENKSGAAEDAMKKLSESTEFQLGRIPATFTKIKIAVGDMLVNFLTLGGTLTPLIRSFNNMGETGQKITGIFALIGSGILLWKSQIFSLIATKVLEIKTNAILAKQRHAEVLQHNAITASIVAENAARKASAVAGATGAVAQVASSAGNASNVIGGSALTIVLLKMKAIFHAIASPAAIVTSLFVKLKGVFVGLLAVLKSTAFAATVFWTSIAALAVGIVDYTQSFIRSLGELKNGWSSFYTSFKENLTVFQWIADFIAGIGKMKRNQQAFNNTQDEKAQFYNTTRFVKTFAADLQKTMEEEFKRLIVVPDMSPLEKMKLHLDNFSVALKSYSSKYNSKDMSNLQKQAEAARLELTDYYDEYSYAEKKGKLTEAHRQKMEELKKKWSDIEKKLQEANEKQGNAARELADYLKKIRDFLNPINNFMNTVKDVNKSIEWSRIQSSGDVSKQFSFKTQEAEYSRKEFRNSAKTGDYDKAAQAYRSMMDTWMQAVDIAKREMESYNRIYESAKDDIYGAQMKRAGSVAAQTALMRKKAEELYRDSGLRFQDGNVSFSKSFKSAKDLDESYRNSVKAVNLEINAKQKEIEKQRELVNAELAANANTVKLIQSMDKFNKTSVEAVKVNSSDAIKLTSRRFNEIASYSPSQTAQKGLGQSNAQINELYKKLEDIANAFKQRASDQSQTWQKSMQEKENAISQAMEKMSSVMPNLETAAKDIADTVKKLPDALKTGEQERYLKNLNTTMNNLNTVFSNAVNI